MNLSQGLKSKDMGFRRLKMTISDGVVTVDYHIQNKGTAGGNIRIFYQINVNQINVKENKNDSRRVISGNR